MPWSMNDYPNSLKHFNKATKKKAIDIANALIDEGYSEDRAIPIATEQAKKWYDHATEKERTDYVQNEDPTIRTSNHHSRPALLDKQELVVPYHDNQWAVQSDDTKKPAKIFSVKKDAIDYGKSVAKNKQTGLTIQKRNGAIQEKIDYRKR